MTNKEVEDFVNWLQSLTAKKFYSEDAEDLIHEYKNKALSQHDVIKNEVAVCEHSETENLYCDVGWAIEGKRCKKCKQTVL